MNCNNLDISIGGLESMHFMSKKQYEASESYKRLKEHKRTLAGYIQGNISENNYSYGELLEIQSLLEKWGKRYGLLKEFKENGLI